MHCGHCLQSPRLPKRMHWIRWGMGKILSQASEKRPRSQSGRRMAMQHDATWIIRKHDGTAINCILKRHFLFKNLNWVEPCTNYHKFVQGQMPRSWWMRRAMSATRLYFWPMAGWKFLADASMSVGRSIMLQQWQCEHHPTTMEGVVQQWGLHGATLPKKRGKCYSLQTDLGFVVFDRFRSLLVCWQSLLFFSFLS